MDRVVLGGSFVAFYFGLGGDGGGQRQRLATWNDAE
jgi:hypothetical protein